MTSTQIENGDYRTVLDGRTADLIVTSPPYNIGSKSPRLDGQRKKGKYDAKSYGAITGYPDSKDEAVYQEEQEQFLIWAAEHLNEGGILVYNHKPRRRDGELIYPQSWMLTSDVLDVLSPMEEIIWDRGSTHNHSNRMMWPTTERLYVFRRKADKYTFTNTSDLPERSDLWRIPLTSRSQKDTGHCAPFPMAVVTAVILAFSTEGQTVMDPYTGSGTTALAAMNTRRNFIGSEIDPKYFAIATERMNDDLFAGSEGVGDVQQADEHGSFPLFQD
jgi:modification methylase